MNTTVKTILSKLELKIPELVAIGYTSEKIGAALPITRSTLQTHRSNMLR